MMKAKRKKLTNYFGNAMREFTDLAPGDEKRVVVARWVLTCSCSMGSRIHKGYYHTSER